jgi:hypothetical protein
MLDRKMLSRDAAAEYVRRRDIPLETSTLAKYASVGGGPEMRKFGRRVLYETDALDAWIESKLTPPRRSTSDNGSDR